MLGHNSQLKQIAERLGEIEASLKRVARRQSDVQRQVAAITRILTIGELEAYPGRLTARRFRLASQNEEDGLTCALLHEIGVPLCRFVEIGAGANGGNSGFLVSELGFEGMMVDQGDDRLKAVEQFLQTTDRVKVVAEWVTAENINGLIKANGFDSEIDVFSLDIDGNDYWVWKALTACSPRIVIVEYNSLFGPDRSVTIPYDPEFSVAKDGPFGRAYYYGASLRALTELARTTKGYRLVAVEPQGVNAFFLRADVASHVPACDPRAAYRINHRDRKLFANGFDVYEAMETANRPIVDVSAEDCGS